MFISIFLSCGLMSGFFPPGKQIQHCYKNIHKTEKNKGRILKKELHCHAHKKKTQLIFAR